jgi:hypothetical protein
VLWLEFDQPLQDPHDVYFGRVLANAPDPALTARRTRRTWPSHRCPSGAPYFSRTYGSYNPEG